MIGFDKIPQSIRTPLFYAEFDSSKANSGLQNARALLIGQKLAAGTLGVNVPQLVTSLAAAKAGAGEGSALAQMYESYRRSDAVGEVWVLPLADNAGGAQAAGSATIGGTATGNGTISLYAGGRRVSVGVLVGDTADEIATATAAAIVAASDLAVTAAVDGEEAAQVNITAKHKGTVGNDIDLRVNYAGVIGGEALPAGITVTIVPMSGGATDPDLTTALANLGDDEYDFIAIAFNDTTVLDQIKTLMDEDTGRWSWSRQIYGAVFAAKRGTIGALSTFGGSRNDKAVTTMGFYGSPTPFWEWSASYCAQAAVSINAHPARPLQTLPLIGIKAPAREVRFMLNERETLLHDGIATYDVARDGTVRISREVTNYQENLYGQPDDSWLDVVVLSIGWTFVRRMRSRTTTEFPRHLLAADGTRIGEGQPVVTPLSYKAACVSEYIELEREGIVQNTKHFIENTVVEIAGTTGAEKSRLNVLFAPVFMGQARIIAVRVQFT